MTAQDFPQLVPPALLPVGDADVAKSVDDCQSGESAGLSEKQVVRHQMLEFLSLPPRYLPPGEILDEQILRSPEVVAFVFTPYRTFGSHRLFHPVQKRQMITIYNLLPYGTKGPWCARHDLQSCHIKRWARALQVSKSDDGFDGIQRAKRAVDDAYRGRYSPEYIREMVIEYAMVPHGQKEAWLIEHGLADHTVRRWTAMVADGDLPTRTTPRRIGTLTMDECVEIKQLRKEVSALVQQKRKLELDAKRREEAMQRALDKATERAERAELATDALGKALATMPGQRGVDSNAEEKCSPKSNNTSTTKDDRQKKH